MCICSFYIYIIHLKTVEFTVTVLLVSFILGQEGSPYAKQNYEKYLSALKNSGLVSVEEKALPASAESPAGEEEATGTLASSGEAPPLPSYGPPTMQHGLMESLLYVFVFPGAAAAGSTEEASKEVNTDPTQ